MWDSTPLEQSGKKKKEQRQRLSAPHACGLSQARTSSVFPSAKASSSPKRPWPLHRSTGQVQEIPAHQHRLLTEALRPSYSRRAPSPASSSSPLSYPVVSQGPPPVTCALIPPAASGGLSHPTINLVQTHDREHWQRGRRRRCFFTTGVKGGLHLLRRTSL